MRVISTGNTYEIFDDTLRTYEQLPSKSYIVRFSKFKGFFLEKYNDIEIKEDKIYGVQNEKVTKVLNAFEKTTRSLGVILSGDKGIGKSLFSKLLSVEAINRGIPLIIVNQFIPGIASYIESIDQEVMVLFDEFDKTFGSIRAGDGEESPQTSLLTLFDGISNGKKLFVITCNDLTKLSDYFINRPGRFHYHFRFKYPTSNEVKDYLEDKLDEQYYGEIDSIVQFARKINLNYDCLRAIAFEVNNGSTFREAISDLNIINFGRRMKYDITLYYKNGIKAMADKNVKIDMFSDSNQSFWLYDSTQGVYYVKVIFNISDAEYDDEEKEYYVSPDHLRIIYNNDCDDLVDKVKSTEVKCLKISLSQSEELHYIV